MTALARSVSILMMAAALTAASVASAAATDAAGETAAVDLGRPIRLGPEGVIIGQAEIEPLRHARPQYGP